MGNMVASLVCIGLFFALYFVFSPSLASGALPYELVADVLQGALRTLSSALQEFMTPRPAGQAIATLGIRG